MTISHVGLIGAGLMGHGIGKNILAKGFRLTVVGHRNRAPIEDLIARGAKELASPNALTKACDAIILCVTGTPEVEQATRDMIELLDALGHDRAVWVGHDWGTPVVWSLAAHHAEEALLDRGEEPCRLGILLLCDLRLVRGGRGGGD